MAQNQDPQEHILIARNNETGQTGAVVGQNPDGSPQTADIKSTPITQFVCFNKQQNPIEAFLANFIRQAKNPSLFGFFKVPYDEAATTGVVMSDMLADPEGNKEMLAAYKVDLPEKTQRRNNAIDESKIDWNTIEKEWGIKRDDLAKSGDLTSMLYNRKSQLVSLSPEMAGEKFDLEARLSFRTNPDGSVTLVPHFPQKEPKLDVEYRGYAFTDDDKEQLLKNGNLGHPVELLNPETGKMEKSLVSLDRITNEIESVPLDKVYIHGHIGKTELSMPEILSLKEGKMVENKEIELADGRKFTTNLQYNAERRDVEFIYEQGQSQGEKNDQKQSHNNWLDENGNIRKITQWSKKPLTEQQQADYMAGKQITVTDVKDRNGNDCTVFVQFDPEAKRPKTVYNYPDKAKVVGVAEESKTQVAVNNEGKTNEATNRVNEPLQKGQTAPKDESQQKKQTKPKGPKP